MRSPDSGGHGGAWCSSTPTPCSGEAQAGRTPVQEHGAWGWRVWGLAHLPCHCSMLPLELGEGGPSALAAGLSQVAQVGGLDLKVWEGQDVFLTGSPEWSLNQAPPN